MAKFIGVYFNSITGRPICYVINRWKVTLNPKEACEYEHGLDLYPMLDEILKGIYNGNDSGNMTEHEYYHIREDYFYGIKKKNVIPMVSTKDNEIVYMRKLKLLKLNDKR